MLNQRPPGRTLLGFITTKRCVIGKTQLGQQSKSSNLMPPKPFANGPRSILLATWSSNCSKRDMNSIKNGLREVCNLASLTWAWCAFSKLWRWPCVRESKRQPLPRPVARGKANGLRSLAVVVFLHFPTQVTLKTLAYRPNSAVAQVSISQGFWVPSKPQPDETIPPNFCNSLACLGYDIPL